MQLHELRHVTKPSVDNTGVLFEKDGRILRAFAGENAALIQDILDSTWLEDLFEAGLVRFKRADDRVQGYELVVECERVAVESYPQEWPSAMLRDAGKTICRVAQVLARHGLMLKDSHPWNILFDNTRPVFVDLGSIIRGTHVTHEWLHEFRRHIVLPLYLRMRGLSTFAEFVEREERIVGIKKQLDHRLLRFTTPPAFALLRLRANDPIPFFNELITYLEGLQPLRRQTEWSHYEQKSISLTTPEQFSPKQRAVDTFLQEIRPGQVLDVACNRGWYSRLAVKHGHRVIAFDLDDIALNETYLTAKQAQAPIVTLRMDFLYPSGSSGMGLGREDGIKRFKSDHAILLAILHHLCNKQGVNFDFFAQLVDRYVVESAIVEFIPKEDEHVSRWPLAKASWYNVDNFITAMRHYFPKVDELPSFPTPRKMFLFRRG